MLCGTRSFKHIDGDNPASPAPPTPKPRLRRSRSQNPYSNRGLDKFSTVMAELEAMREQIISKSAATADDDSLTVHFMYSDSKDWIPIVIKSPESPKSTKTQKPTPLDMTTQLSSKAVAEKKVDKKRSFLCRVDERRRPSYDWIPIVVKSPESPTSTKTQKPLPMKTTTQFSSKAVAERKLEKNWSFSFGADERRRPSYHWPAVAVVVLLCLMMFGRMFAICCASIWWYLVPTINGDFSKGRRNSMEKKVYGRKEVTGTRG